MERIELERRIDFGDFTPTLELRLFPLSILPEGLRLILSWSFFFFFLMPNGIY